MSVLQGKGPERSKWQLLLLIRNGQCSLQSQFGCMFRPLQSFWFRRHTAANSLPRHRSHLAIPLLRTRRRHCSRARMLLERVWVLLTRKHWKRGKCWGQWKKPVQPEKDMPYSFWGLIPLAVAHHYKIQDFSLSFPSTPHVTGIIHLAH